MSGYKNIGFTTGCLYRFFDDIHSNKAIISISNPSTNSIELLARKSSDLDSLLNIDPSLLKNFQNVSIHAPVKIRYRNDKETRVVLNKLEIATKKFNARLIVLHPDLIEDYSIFNEYSTLPFAIENMDRDKVFGKVPDDLERSFEKYNFKFLLDLQHVFVNDPTLKLCDRFLGQYLDRLEEIHISAYDDEFVHYLLYKGGQNVVVNKLKEIISLKDIPIIIEGSIDRLKDLELELEYINFY